MTKYCKQTVKIRVASAQAKSSQLLEIRNDCLLGYHVSVIQDCTSAHITHYRKEITMHQSGNTRNMLKRSNCWTLSALKVQAQLNRAAYSASSEGTSTWNLACDGERATITRVQGSVSVLMLPARMRWLRRCDLEAIQAALSKVLGVLLCQATLRLVESWVPMASKLGRLWLLRLTKATQLTLSLVTIKVVRRKRRDRSWTRAMKPHSRVIALKEITINHHFCKNLHPQKKWRWLGREQKASQVTWASAWWLPAGEPCIDWCLCTVCSMLHQSQELLQSQNSD